MRYFMAQPNASLPGIFTAEVRDLCAGLYEEDPENREFLHKYMTLTRCDLLFADRSILVEGSTERLLLPKMIEKIDDGQPIERRLGSQYVSIMEVGGAYAHIFFNLLDFLKLRTLIITDLDTIDANNNRRKCKVSEGTHSSNSCINKWFAPGDAKKPTKDQLLAKGSADKLSNVRRLAFQIPHSDGDACGRSFEDAFMLANPTLFDINGHTPAEREEHAWQAAKAVDKTDFALKYAIEETAWATPRYIEEGLRWLAEPPMAIVSPEKVPLEGAPADKPLDTEGDGND
jgi:predicted ATP-dependent endonuclease of OLD family